MGAHLSESIDIRSLRQCRGDFEVLVLEDQIESWKACALVIRADGIDRGGRQRALAGVEQWQNILSVTLAADPEREWLLVIVENKVRLLGRRIIGWRSNLDERRRDLKLVFGGVVDLDVQAAEGYERSCRRADATSHTVSGCRRSPRS